MTKMTPPTVISVISCQMVMSCNYHFSTYPVSFLCSPTSTGYLESQQNFCCINKSTMKHQQKLHRKLDLPRFNFGYQNACC